MPITPPLISSDGGEMRPLQTPRSLEMRDGGFHAHFSFHSRYLTAGDHHERPPSPTVTATADDRTTRQDTTRSGGKGWAISPTPNGVTF